jgi:hypothetical protein
MSIAPTSNSATASRQVGGSTRSKFAARQGHATPAFRLIGSEKILDGVDFALAGPGECEGDFTTFCPLRDRSSGPGDVD